MCLSAFFFSFSLLLLSSLVLLYRFYCVYERCMKTRHDMMIMMQMMIVHVEENREPLKISSKFFICVFQRTNTHTHNTQLVDCNNCSQNVIVEFILRWVLNCLLLRKEAANASNARYEKTCLFILLFVIIIFN